jgi:hypothetical protein
MNCREKEESMVGKTLRRRGIVVLAVSLSLLPLASVQAQPREEAAKMTASRQIQDFGRTLVKLVQEALGVTDPETTGSSGAATEPWGTDGIGIDPNGGYKP